MKKLGLALLLAVLGLAPAQAQNFTMPPPAGVTVGGFVVVASCGGQSLSATQGFGTMDATGKLCVNASVSASITGFPTIQTTGTPISVTTGGVTGTLPTGAVVVASNVGATNGAYCKLGASATTSDQLIPPNSWFAFAVGAATQLTCITSASTTTVNMVGGSGLPTGSGGGGGSGVGLSVAFAGAIGANGTPGGFKDGSGNFQAFLGDTTNGQWVNVKAASGLAIGSTTSGSTGSLILCATTTSISGGTNAQNNPFNCTPAGALRNDLATIAGTTVLAGTGAQAAGAQRVTVATDQATNAGAALVKGGVGVVNGGNTYQHVAASQTGAVLQTSTGAIGDYLSHCVIYPTTTAAGSVTVFDNTNAAGTNVIEFTTGTLSNLAPIAIPVGAVSTAGAWKVTTGANETVVCYGKFS